MTEFLHINLISLLAHHTGLHSPLSLARIPTQTQAHIHMRIIANTLKPTERNAFTLYTVSAKSFHCGGSVHSVHQSARVSPASLCHKSCVLCVRVSVQYLSSNHNPQYNNKYYRDKMARALINLSKTLHLNGGVNQHLAAVSAVTPSTMPSSRNCESTRAVCEHNSQHKCVIADRKRATMR